MIKYPYLPEEKVIKFVPKNNKFIQEAKKMADKYTGCSWWPTGAVVVMNGKIIGRGSNPAGKLVVPCPRWEQQCPTGTGYNLCNEVCKRVGLSHSEINAVEDALKRHKDIKGADLYLFGHWWCCKDCWDTMIKAGIENVYLLKNADKIFDTKPRKDLQAKFSREKKIGKIHTLKDIVWKMK